ncbi:MAG: universal stress protein [Gammaproteobacteria bacterium]|nr:MAG: universal stress protein [Gammaproteobacteria bacterium]
MRRILIALDPAAPRGDALEAVAALCRSTEAELTGVFIEDDNLSRLATLPFAREIRLTGVTSRSLDSGLLRLQLDACAREFEQAFEQARIRLKTRVSFRRLQGDVFAELRRAAAEVDLVVVGRSLKSAGLRTWLGVPAERLLEAVAQGPAPIGLLFVHEPWATGRAVLVLDDGSETSQRAVEQAMAIAEADDLPLELCRLGHAATGGTADDPGAAFAAQDLASLRQLCMERNPRLLVLPDTPAVRARIDFRELLSDLPASVAITR